MKRIGGLMPRILDVENLKLAFWKASRSKRHRADQREYQSNLDDEIALLSQGLRSGRYPVGVYRRFTIYEPKERNICAAAFRERVLHHALMNVCGPLFEKWLVERTYACVKGRGQTAAIEKACAYAGKYKWFLKCDIRKFFDSIPHDRIRAKLARKIKDREVLAWFDRILATYSTASDRGLPMGNLTSQHLANLYLDGIDRLPCLVGLGYVRYMDDFVVWSNDKEQLKTVRARIRTFVSEGLGLELKDNAYINASSMGVDFLGRRVFPYGSIPSRRSRTRCRRMVAELERAYDYGEIDESALQCRVTSLTSFVRVSGCGAKFRLRACNQGHMACHGFTAAGAGGTPQRIAVHPGVTGTSLGTAGTTTASALPARSTAGWTDGPDARPASDKGTNPNQGPVSVG